MEDKVTTVKFKEVGILDVDIKDRDKEVEKFRLALNMCGISIDYITTELIWEIFNKIQNEKEDDMMSMIDLQSKWKEKWSEYFKNKISIGDVEKLCQSAFYSGRERTEDKNGKVINFTNTFESWKEESL